MSRGSYTGGNVKQSICGKKWRNIRDLIYDHDLTN